MLFLTFYCAYRYAGVMDVRSDIFPGSPDGIHLRDVSVRLARPDERSTRWDSLMNQHHYLGFKRFAGRGLRHVFEWRGHWVDLIGWQSGAFNYRPRDRWIGWMPELQFTRMHLIANKQYPFSHSWCARLFPEPRFLCACRDGSALER